MCDSGGCVQCVTVKGMYCVKTAPATGPVCENNGTCESGRCRCPPGYGGHRCEQSTYVRTVYIIYVFMYYTLLYCMYVYTYVGTYCMCVYVLYVHMCVYTSKFDIHEIFFPLEPPRQSTDRKTNYLTF